MAEPLVTVLMPARNAGAFITEAINSVLNQTFTDFELLIVNDGSADNTLSLIQEFNDPRIRIVNREASGIAASLNAGLQEARGTLVARFDADDICLPRRLEKQFVFLQSHPEYVVTGCDAEYITETGEHLFDFYCTGHSHNEIMQQLKIYCPFIHSAVMYRKQAVINAGGYSYHAHQFEDYLLWIRLQPFGGYHNIPEQLIKVRFNPDSVTIDEKWRSRHFRLLKRKIIRQGFVTPDEGNALLEELQKQDNPKLKSGAYEALCGKKFLLDNHQPRKARKYLRRAMHLFPFRIDIYALYLLSFFPVNFIRWLHHKSPNKI